MIASPELLVSSNEHPENQYLASNHLRCMYCGYLLDDNLSERSQVVSSEYTDQYTWNTYTYRPKHGEKLFGS